MGGFVATEAVIEQPERFEKLVLVSAAGVSSVRLKREPTEVGRPDARRRRSLRVQPSDALVQAPASTCDRVSEHLPPPRRAAARSCSGSSSRAACAARRSPTRSSALAGYDFLDRLDEVEVPTLIVWGRNDNVVPPADALEYGRLLRNSRIVIFDDTGHVPMAERPVRFNRVLETFLAEP